LIITEKQYQLGYVNFQTLLAAQQAYEQAQITLVQARTNSYGDTAALFQALGGGWWNRPASKADTKAETKADIQADTQADAGTDIAVQAGSK